jgi:hypothetical protein
MGLRGLSLAASSAAVAALALTGAGQAQAQPAVVLAAGDIAGCFSSGDEATAALLDQQEGTIVTLGDNAYPDGSASDFANCYEPSWGRHKARTRPSIGNHEYRTPGGAGHFGYFGPAAGDPSRGYYSFDVGSWHLIALNSNCTFVDCGYQAEWLRADLAASRASCTLAYWHHARFSSGRWGQLEFTEIFWKPLYEHGADLVLSGHDHIYERHAPQAPSGDRNDAHGIREFIVGSGGHSHSGIVAPLPTSEALDNNTFGVLKLTLRDNGYDWIFLPESGASFTDAGSGTCHGPPADVTSPSVSLDTPGASGTIVRGAAELAATASDNVGVARVEFMVDATLVGRDAVAPYHTTWDSTNVPDGLRWLRARAVDTSGNPTNSESRYIVIDNALPETKLVATPVEFSRSTSPTFRFSSEPGATFECKVDRRRFTGCSSPFRSRGLSEGPHMFTVRARDAAGNFERTPASWRWTIDLTPPSTSIPYAEMALGPSGEAQFSLRSSERPGSFLCSLDRGPWTFCSSPAAYSDLATGRHTFRVAARDRAGNTHWSGVTRTWRASATGTGRYITGSSGTDELRGTHGDDVIEGYGGADVILARGGNDKLMGGAGSDRLDGGAGNDRLIGDEGADLLFGGRGRDILFSRDGTRDLVHGGPGRDRALADSFLDRLRAVEARR